MSSQSDLRRRFQKGHRLASWVHFIDRVKSFKTGSRLTTRSQNTYGTEHLCHPGYFGGGPGPPDGSSHG